MIHSTVFDAQPQRGDFFGAHIHTRARRICGGFTAITPVSEYRNWITEGSARLRGLGYTVRENRARGYIDVAGKRRKNRFYLFGGRDESSASLIQGITLAGVLLDEVALMPESFVNQATARCSVTGSKFWFNCNPGSPQHWFYLEWVRKCRSRKMMYLHFTMDDNLSLSEDIKARYRSQYSGVFSALGSYLQTRADMVARSYAVSPSDLDEDGNAVDTPSYNEYGDYVLYRPDAVDDTPIYGLPVDYTTASFPYDTYIAPANAEFDRFAADGVRVYLTYSPRNSRAVSADSTPEAVAALDAYFRENLDVVFLTPLQDSLMPGRYFYGTDNHLSTNGVTMRTAQVIDALTKQLQGEGIAP